MEYRFQYSADISSKLYCHDTSSSAGAVRYYSTELAPDMEEEEEDVYCKSWLLVSLPQRCFGTLNIIHLIASALSYRQRNLSTTHLKTATSTTNSLTVLLQAHSETSHYA